ncbi:MAG TPA: hypothetical protein GX715_15060 [Armatimonadetes bacterium]|jgi:hypothetical protein|nr:hypothetical protein [Armatimonadota bacterium]
MKMQFQHVGLTTDQKQPGEVFVPETKVWVTSPDDHPYHIEYLRYEPDSPVRGPVRDLPHMAFRVSNLKEAIGDSEILLGPFEASPGLNVAFVLKDGAVFEYMEYADESALPWK